MELHTKQFQIGMNSGIAAQLWTRPEMLMVISKKRCPESCSTSVTIRHGLQQLSL